MSQGLIGGTLWGVLAAGIGLVAVSQIAPPPHGGKAADSGVTASAAPAAQQPQAAPKTATAEVPQVAGSAPADAPKATPPASPAMASAEAVATPAPDDLAATAPQPTAPAAAPAPAAPQLAAAAAPDAPPLPAASAGAAGPKIGKLPQIAATEVAPPAVTDAGTQPSEAAAPGADAPAVRDGKLPQIATGDAAAGDGTTATASTTATATASGAKTVVAPAKPAGTDSAPATPARAPRVETEAPEALRAVSAGAAQTYLRPVSVASRAAPAAPPAIAAAGPAPAAPNRPAPPGAATIVMTAAPPAARPVLVDAGDDAAPAVITRATFAPDLVFPAEAPTADTPPDTGALPPPPPLTAEELAIVAPAAPGTGQPEVILLDETPPAAQPGATDSPARPGVIVLGEATPPAQPKILKKPKPLVPNPSLATEGKAPGSKDLPRITAKPATEQAEAPAATGPVFKAAPKSGGEAAPLPAPAPDAAAEPDDAATAKDTRPPIERFARPFENAAGKPLFTIVLIDTGDPQIDRKALAEMPFPVTFALDPAAPESALAASIYRAAGQEVVMLASGLPEGATASDVEVSLGANEAVLPESVAVLDTEAGGFQGNRPLATLVVPVVKGQGRGLLSWDRGLNAASQVARREGLRSGVIFRRLDGEGEPKDQIRRYLDRAAFKAAQDGRVIVAGETKPDTVAALLEWAVEGRAATVALAPLTAALRAE